MKLKFSDWNQKFSKLQILEWTVAIRANKKNAKWEQIGVSGVRRGSFLQFVLTLIGGVGVWVEFVPTVMGKIDLSCGET